jgi:4-amino-4-deoxy-L-arabinose transferase-like glycosyltransferase
MLSNLRPQLVLAAVAGLAFFLNLGGTHLWDVDEAIFSQAGKEMYQRGDAVTPYFNGQVFPDKPGMMYWAMMLGFELFGTNEFAARFFSAVFGVGSVLITYRIGRLIFSPSAAFWAGMILATSLNFTVIARAATPDSYLTFFSALAMLAFVAGTAKARPMSGEANERNIPWAGQTRFEPGWLSWCGVYAVMGLGVLTKGPIGVVLPTASIGLFLLVMRAKDPAAAREPGLRGAVAASGGWLVRVFNPLHVMKTIWSMRPLTAIAMVLLVAGPWYTMVGLATDGEWLVGFFGVHNFGRFANAMDDHSGPIFYYLVAIAVGFFPWSVWASPTILQLRRHFAARHPWRPGYVLVLSWAAVWVGFFSIASTKLPSYIIPAYPALALLTGSFVASWIREPAALPRLFYGLAWSVVLLVGVGLLVGLPIAAHYLLDGQWYLGLVGLVPIVAGVGGWIACWRGQPALACGTMAAAGLAMWVTVFGMLAPVVDEYQDGPAFAATIATQGTGDDAVVRSFHHFRPSYVYYTNTVVEKIDAPEQVQLFFNSHPGRAFVITNEVQFEKLRGVLPADVAVLQRKRQVGQDEDVLLLGRTTVQAAQRTDTPPVR